VNNQKIFLLQKMQKVLKFIADYLSACVRKFRHGANKNLMLQVQADFYNNGNIAVNCRDNMLEN